MPGGRRRGRRGCLLRRLDFPWVGVATVEVDLSTCVGLPPGPDTVVDDRRHDHQTDNPATHSDPYGNGVAFIMSIGRGAGGIAHG